MSILASICLKLAYALKYVLFIIYAVTYYSGNCYGIQQA